MAITAGDIRATMTLDTSKFSDGVARAQTELHTLEANGNKVTNAFGNVESGLTQSAGAIADAMRNAGSGSQSLMELAGRADYANEKVALLSQRTEEARTALEQAQAAAKQSADTLALLEESARASADNLQWAKEQLEQLGKSGDATSGQLAQAKGAVDEFAREVEELNAQIDKQRALNDKNQSAAQRASNRYSSLAVQLTGAENAADKANGRFDALAQTLAGNDRFSLSGLVEAIGSLGSSTLTGASRSLGNIAVKAAGLSTSTAEGALAASGLSKTLNTLTAGLGGTTGLLLSGAGAVAYGAYQLYDYTSGAQAAREALADMSDTAQDWQSTQAKTVFDTGNDAFSVMGVSESDFAASVGTAEIWMDSLKRTWTDGKSETNDIVNEYVAAFTGGSDALRQAVEQRRKMLAGLGVDDSESLQADLDQLEAWDKEVKQLLKKRQNGYLTDEEIERLNTITAEKAKLELEYGISDDTDGFDKILQQVQADVARLQALGEGPSVDSYADGMKAAALGLNDYKQALNDSYSEQYKLIQAMEDGTAKEQALEALNQQYAGQMASGLQRYADTLTQLYGGVWNSPDVQNGQQGMANIAELVRQYNATSDTVTQNSIIQQIGEQLGQLDEGALTSYMAVVMQMVDLFNQGMSVEELSTMFPEIDVTQMLGGYSTIADFLSAHAGQFEGLEGMFGQGGAVPEELQRVAATLELDTTAIDEFLAKPINLKAQWDLSDATIDQPDPINVLINAYEEAKECGMPPDPAVDAVIEKYKKEGSVTAVEWNASTGAVVSYFEDNPDLEYDTDKLDALTAYVTAYDDSTATIDQPDPINVLINAYEEAKECGMPPDPAVDAVIEKYKQEGSVTTVDWLASAGAVVGYFDDNPDLKYDSDKLKNLTAYVSAYDDSGAKKPTIKPITVDVVYRVQEASDALSEGEVKLPEWLGNTTVIDSSLSAIERMTGLLQKLNTPDDAFGPGFLGDTLQNMNLSGVKDDIVSFLTGVNQAVQEGEELSPEVQAQLQSVLDFIAAVDASGLGGDLTAGIAEGMQAYGFVTSASTVAADLEAALRKACQTHSPSAMTMPIGTDLTAGVGEGMKDTSSLSVAAALAAAAANGALSAAFGGVDASGAGKALMGSAVGGLADEADDFGDAGDNAGAAFVDELRSHVSAAARAATAIGSAAYNALKASLSIHSPSRKMRRLGAYTGEGYALGISDEIAASEASIRRLAGATVKAAAGATSNHYNNAVNIHLDNASIRSEDDVRSLARQLGRYITDAHGR